MLQTTGLALLLGAFVSSASAGDAAPPPTRDEQVLDYVGTYGPIAANARRRVLDAACLDDEAAAETKLVEMGEPARRVLLSFVANRPKAIKHLTGVRDRLESLHADVARRGLDHDVGWLAAAGPAGTERLDRILPKEAPRKDVVAWWTLHGRAYRWEPTADRFVPAVDTPAGSVSLRLRDRATVRLADTTNLVTPGNAFTIEMWWRPGDATTEIVLAGDECWPEMSSDGLHPETKCGWVLRRTPDGNGAAHLEFVAAVAPNDWWGLSSPPSLVTSRWEHVAVVSTGDSVRIFRDGECVAAKRCDDRKFLRCPTDLYVGPREHVRDDQRWANRVAHHDLRGVRISEGARYKDDFTPPASLDKDGATLVALEFAADAAKLRDISGHGHDGVIVGGNWITPLDAADARRVFKAFGAALGDLTVVEAESGAASADWWLSERDGMSDGYIVEIWSDRETDALGHWAKVPLRVQKAGTYRVWFVGGNLERHVGEAPFDYSPFSWRVDDAPAQRVAGGVPTVTGMRVERGMSALGVVELMAGEHVFDLRLVDRRKTDNHWSLWFDGIVLERIE